MRHVILAAAHVASVESHGFMALPTSRNKLQCASTKEDCDNPCLTDQETGNNGNMPPGKFQACTKFKKGKVPAENKFYEGQSVPAAFTLTAAHGGAVRWYICNDGSDTLDCFHRNPVFYEEHAENPAVDATDQWGKATGGVKCGQHKKELTKVTLMMPTNVSCQPTCTLLWEWHNTGMKDVPSAINQKNTIIPQASLWTNCADISIDPVDPSPTPPPPSPYTPSPPYAPTPPAPPPRPIPVSNPWNMVAWPGEAWNEVCLDVVNGDMSNGAPLQIWYCNGLDAQKWQFNNWQIQLLNTNKCIDVPGGNLQAGQALQIWDCNGMAGQQWGYDADARSVFLAASGKDASLCMDVTGGVSNPSAAVQIWDCNALAQQRWYVPPSFGSFSIQNLRQNSFLCLDLLGQYTTNGFPVGYWECNGYEGQSWIFEGDTWNIKWAKDMSKCLDIPGSNYQNGQKLWIWDCNGSDNQKFGYDPDMKTIYAAASSDASMCLDVPRDADAGAAVWLWECNGATQQQWAVPSSYARSTSKAELI